MPLTFIEPEARSRVKGAHTVTLSESGSARLSVSAAEVLRKHANGVLRVRVGSDGKRVALAVDPNGREVSTYGSFPGVELAKALGSPAATVKHKLIAAKADDGFHGFWLGEAVPTKAKATK